MQSASPVPSRVLLATGLLVALFAVGCGADAEDANQAFPGITATHPDAGAYGGATTGDARSGDADGADTPPRPPLETALDEPGPYNVGYRKLQVAYQAVADESMEKREFDVSIWYPTRQEEGRPAEYFSIAQDGIIAEAEVAPLETMPLLLFSHGNGGIAEQNYFMTEFWASRGWLVVSPSHVGNTIRSGTDINIDAAVYRPQDIRAVLDRLLHLEKSHPLSGAIATDEIVMSGHSFGGYTTLANAGAEFAIETLRMRCENGSDEISRDYCETFNTPNKRELFKSGFLDERIDVAVPQAPAGAEIFMEGLSALNPPTMLMTGGMDRTLPNEEEGDPIWEYMKGENHRRVNLPEAGHFTFSNMCGFTRDVFGSVPDRVADDGCSEENIDPNRAHEIINTYALAFARYHLWGVDEEVVDGDRKPVGTDGFELSVGAD